MDKQQSAAHHQPLPLDIPWLQSKILLQELSRVSPQKRTNQQFWDKLKSERPNLTDFLLSASYQLAADEPVLRAEIAAFGVALIGIMEETREQKPGASVLKLVDADTRDYAC